MDLPELELFWQYVDHWASIDPTFPSIKYGKKVINAKEFEEQTDQLAQALLHLGVQKGDTVVTVLPTIPEFILTFLAASKIGAITIPMDKEYKKADFQSLIPHSDPRVIITIDKWEKNKIAATLEELKDEFGEVKYIMVGKHPLGANFEEIMRQEYNLEDDLKKAKEDQDENETILVIWTGGTTGAPKPVELTHKNIIQMCLREFNSIFTSLASAGYSPEDHRIPSLVNLPVSHVGGTVELLGTGIVSGLQMIVQASWSPWDSLKAMKKYKIHFMGGVPTMFKIFLSLPDLDNYEPKKYLDLVVMSGEKVNMELLKGVKERICENISIGYGSTEAGPETTFTEPGVEFEKLVKGFVGKALAGQEIIIVDEDGNELPTGEEGEILVRGPLIAKSYFKMPEKNEEGFNEDGFCKTGDLGYKDEEGGLYITGRIKQIIRVGAYTVYPTEIEELALSHPKVAIAAALGAPDELKGEVVWLVIGPELGVKFDDSDKEEILKICEENLAKFAVPRKIIVYPLDPNDLPITRIGKVDRVRLEKELIPK
jgi:acyl-CoA synthetase (AMP-forming)/AMP-acid ligase II